MQGKGRLVVENTGLAGFNVVSVTVLLSDLRSLFDASAFFLQSNVGC